MTDKTITRRAQLYKILGDLPPLSRTITVLQREILVYQGYSLEKMLLDLNGVEPVPAYLLKPKNVFGRLPTILYNHSHGGHYEIGKEEIIRGAEYLQSPPYGEALTSMGYAAFCIDTWLFGERSGKRESELFKEMLWSGKSLWGMMVYDSLKALDYLCSRDDLDPGRVGTLGMSMGSTMAWWLAALDERISVCVDICGLTDFQALLETKGLDLHGLYYYIPGLLKQFTTAQINSLIAPRPHLSLAGEQDPLTPLAGLNRINLDLKQVYEQLNAAGAWELRCYDSGHIETPNMRERALAFISRWL